MPKMKMTINEAIKCLEKEECPHRPRIACSVCEREEQCAATEKLLDFVKFKEYEDGGTNA